MKIMIEHSVAIVRRVRFFRFYCFFFIAFSYLVLNVKKVSTDASGRASLLVSLRKDEQNALKIEISSDYAFVSSWNGYDPSLEVDVTYLRGADQLRGVSGCNSTIDVITWLSSKMMTKHRVFALAYGELLHFFREGDFIDSKTGQYIDDDFDMWAFPDTVMDIIKLESEMYQRFGWSMRLFLFDGYIVFVQLIALCGHTTSKDIAKASSDEPGIELYPVVKFRMEGADFNTLKDIWQGATFPEQMVVPTVHVSLRSNTSLAELHLQLPRAAEALLSCIYGDWSKKSEQHAVGGERCNDDRLK